MPSSTLDRSRTRARPSDWVVVVQGKPPVDPSGATAPHRVTASAATAVIVPPIRRTPSAPAFAPSGYLPFKLPTKLPKGLGQLMILTALIVTVVGGPMLAYGQNPSVALGLRAPEFVAYGDATAENVRYTLNDGWSQTAAVPGALLMDWRAGAGDQTLRLTLGNPLAEPEIEAMSADGTRIEEIRYRGAWPGIDAVMKAMPGGFSINFMVAPGVDPSIIDLEYVGATELTIDPTGRLRVKSPNGTWVDGAPESWQDGPNGREPVDSKFEIRDGSRFGFFVGAYDPSRPLVVDPPSEREN